MYLQAVADFIVRDIGQRTRFSGKQVLRRGGIHEQFDGISGACAGACVKLTWPDFTKKLQILDFDTAGGNSWL
jgi:hypothetical protein